MNNEFENRKRDLDEDWAVNEPSLRSKPAADFAGDSEVSLAGPQNQANSDDWAMNTMVSSRNIQNPSERTVSASQTVNAPDTNPLDKKQGEWQMPEPEFRVSSGKKVEKSVLATPRPDFSAKSPEILETTGSVEIQPQPYISEALLGGGEQMIGHSPAEVKSKAGRTMFIVAGILTMVLFAVGFLIGIYFLFFRQTGL